MTSVISCSHSSFYLIDGGLSGLILEINIYFEGKFVHFLFMSVFVLMESFPDVMKMMKGVCCSQSDGCSLVRIR